jgi:hypothetical protein
MSNSITATAYSESAQSCAQRTASNNAAPSSAALRMRRSRQRARQGLKSIRFSIKNTEIAALAGLGYLAPDLQADRVAISKALGLLLDKLMELPDLVTRLQAGG